MRSRAQRTTMIFDRESRLDVTHSSIELAEGESEAEVDPSDAGAEAESSGGT